jgi:hypothetical protein
MRYSLSLLGLEKVQLGVQMVTMISSHSGSIDNYGERVLYNAFEAVPDRDDWIVIHSLHQYKTVKGNETEGDFIVLIPGKGIVVIESKGATQVTLEGDIWTLDGVPSGATNKSPLEQAERTRNNILAQLRKNDIDDVALPVARLVWFPKMDPFMFAEIGERGMEMHSWELAFREDLKKLVPTIEKAVDGQISVGIETKELPYKPELFDLAEMKRIKDALRVRASALYTKDGISEVRQNSLIDGTKHLDKLWRTIRGNQNFYFDGAAGTGKSYLLGKAAVAVASEGRQVLVTCYSQMMADEYRIRFENNPNIDVKPIYDLFLDVAQLKSHKRGDGWYDEELPTLAINAVNYNEFLARYDAICIDEFQDIASKPKVVDAIFRFYNTASPLEYATVLAGDDFQQIMATGSAVKGFDIAKAYLPDLMHINLESNCRQAPGLRERIFKFLNANEIPKNDELPRDVDWSFEVIQTKEGKETKALAEVLRKLLETNSPEQIRILSPYGEKQSLLAKLFSRESESADERWLKQQLRHKSSNGQVRWRSIAKYKGLEQDVVIITDINKTSRDWVKEKGRKFGDLLYVGLTRARFQVVLLVGDELYPAMLKTS